MTDVFDAVSVGGFDDASLLGNAADLGDVGLNDVECASLEKRHETLSRCENFGASDRHFAVFAQGDKILEIVGAQSFFKPVDFIMVQHVRRAHGPFESMRPEPVARARVDHEVLTFRQHVSCGAYDRLILPIGIRPSERAPTDLEGAVALLAVANDLLRHFGGFIH